MKKNDIGEYIKKLIALNTEGKCFVSFLKNNL
jgi:hypothetical protein